MSLQEDASDSLNRLFRSVTTYTVMGFATLLLAFVFYLGGREGVYSAFAWVGNVEDMTASLGFPVVGYYLGWLLILYGFDRYRHYTLIRNTPTSTVRAAPMGRVEVKGEVHPLSEEDLVTTPFREVRCVAFECEIEEYHEDDDGGGHWETIHERRVPPPFYLEDGTGALVVEAEDATWAFERDYRETYRLSSPPTHITNYVEDHVDESVLDIDLLGEEDQRFTEWALEAGDEIYVLGGARPAADASVMLPDEVETVVRRDDATDTFFVSDASEKEILKSQWWTGLTALGLGIVAVPGCTVLLLEFLGVL